MTTLPTEVFNDAAGDHVNVFAPLADKLTLVPAHILPDVTAIIGFGMAATVKVATFVHVPTVPITVPEPTDVIPSDVPMMVAPFKVLVVKPTIGPHVYDVAPLAVMFTEFGEALKLFIHIVGLLKAVVMIGKLITDTVPTATCVQVACSPIKVYDVVTVGLTVTFGPVVEVIAVFGDQV